MFFLRPQQGNALIRLKLCANDLKNHLNRFCRSGYLTTSCKFLKSLFIGRYKRRMLAVISLLITLISLVFIINKNALTVVAPVFAVFISGIIGYGAFIDEKRFEMLYNSKLDMYRKVLSEIWTVQKLPVLFLTSDADKIPIDELKNTVKEVNNNLDMLLVSNVVSYSALSSLNKKVQEKLFFLILKFTEINRIGARNIRNLTDGEFYKSLDKSKLSLKSLKEIQSVDSNILTLSSKIDMYSQVMPAMKEINDLLIDLANEMRNDLENGRFSELEIANIKREFDTSIGDSADFLKNFIQQVLENGGIDIEL